MSLSLTLTTAGRVALVNAQNTGTDALTIAAIGVSSTHTAGSLAGLTALPGEIKRMTTFGGAVVAADTMHVTLRDESNDSYTVRAFGLFLSDGTLFGVYSQSTTILEKAPAAILLLAVDVILTVLTTAAITFGGTGFTNPPATTTAQGVVELATPAETAAGTDATRAVTPLGLWQVLTGWAAGFAAAIHNHDASAIISGVLQVGRIPALGMEKITGLAGALVLKASLDSPTFTGPVSLPATTVFRREVAGTGEGGQFVLERPDTDSSLPGNVIVDINGSTFRIFAPGGSNRGVYIDLNAAPAGVTGAIWHSGNFNPADKAASIHSHDWAQVTGKPNVAVQGQSVSFDGLTVTTLAVNGFVPWTAGNFNPADKAAAVHSHDWAQVTGKPAWVDPTAISVTTGYKAFASIEHPIAAVEGGGGLEARSTGAGAAYIGFHRPGAFGSVLGLDVDNQWKVGGWSMGSVAYRIFHEGILMPSSGAEAAAGTATNRFLTPAALWSFARSIGANGYAVIPGTGLMIQWGVSSASIAEGFVDAMLPVAFGGGCVAAVATPRNPTGAIAADYYMQIGGKFLDRISFFANRANSGAGNMAGFEWIALGAVAGTPDAAYSGTPGAGGGGGGSPGSGGGGTSV